MKLRKGLHNLVNFSKGILNIEILGSQKQAKSNVPPLRINTIP